MNCNYDETTGTIEAVMIFKRDELLDDIENCVYIEGHVMETDNPHRRHMVQDAGDEGNVDRVTRMLDLNVAKCRELLYSLTKMKVERTELDNTLKETPTYGIILKLPAKFSQTTLNLLKELVHEYLVSQCVADWLSITYPAKWEIWKVKAEVAENNLKSALMSRSGRTRLRLHPF